METKILQYFNITKKGDLYIGEDHYFGDTEEEKDLIYLITECINRSPNLDIWEDFKRDNNVTETELNDFISTGY